MKNLDKKSLQGANNRLLYYVLGNYNVCSVERAIEDGADVNCKGNNGLSVLMHAIMRADDSVINYLIAAGSDVFYQIQDGLSVLTLAEKHNCYTVINHIKRLNLSLDPANSWIVKNYPEHEKEILNVLFELDQNGLLNDEYRNKINENPEKAGDVIKIIKENYFFRDSPAVPY